VLAPEARARVERLLATLASDPAAPSSVTDVERAREVHVADSLSGLEVAELAAAERICDVGSGAGFPALVLAAALPRAHVDALDSISRKCEFIRRAIAHSGLTNAGVVCGRAEEWAAAGAGGRERYDVVTARAVGRLSTLAELASPLLAPDGVLVAWKGRRDAEEEAELGRAAVALAMAPIAVRWVGPYAGSRHRHLHVIRKVGRTPGDLPRRTGVAKKRPRGAL
jgi:16S rRNA (guanine527-N7)-methyltransferase